jgi:hypothetical protein
MMISDSRRLLFVHVQKTGGSTIDNGLTAALGDVRRIAAAQRHAPLGRLLELEPDLAPYWIVGFVRNPWSRLLSWWRMIDRFRVGAATGNERHVQHLQRNDFIRGVLETCDDFEGFVLHAVDRFPRLHTPQVDYLFTPTRRADFVGRQETLEQDLRAVHARLDLPWVELQSVNIDPTRPDYRDVYTDAMRRKVAEVYARDIDGFAYAF